MRAMLTQVKAFALLRGYRNMSKLALLAGQPVAEAEINPLIVKAEGVVAVDGLVTLRQST